MSSTPRVFGSLSRGAHDACVMGWHHPQPELGPLVLLEPQAEDLLGAVGPDAHEIRDSPGVCRQPEAIPFNHPHTPSTSFRASKASARPLSARASTPRRRITAMNRSSLNQYFDRCDP